MMRPIGIERVSWQKQIAANDIFVLKKLAVDMCQPIFDEMLI